VKLGPAQAGWRVGGRQNEKPSGTNPDGFECMANLRERLFAAALDEACEDAETQRTSSHQKRGSDVGIGNVHAVCRELKNE